MNGWGKKSNMTSKFAKTSSKKKVNGKGKVNGKVNGKGNSKGNSKPPGAAGTTEVDDKSDAFSNWSQAFATLADNTPASVHKGVDYNKNIAPTAGETSDPNVVVEGGYSNGIQTSPVPETTLVRETNNRKKKKGSNYDIA